MYVEFISCFCKILRCHIYSQFSMVLRKTALLSCISRYNIMENVALAIQAILYQLPLQI